MQNMKRRIWMMLLLLVLVTSLGSAMGSPFRFPLDILETITPNYGLQATINGQQVTFTWLAVLAPKGKEVLGYHVYRSTSPDALIAERNRITEFATKQTSFSDYITPGTYYYAVQAVYSDITTAPASPALAVIIEVPKTPGGATTQSSATTPPGQKAPPSTSADDYSSYLYIDGIPGSMDESKPFRASIYVQGFDWGIVQSGTTHVGSGGGAGKANFNDLVIYKPIDSATSKLAIACANGAHIKEAVLTVCRKIKGAEVPVYSITLKDILVSSITMEKDAGQFVEKVTFNYAQINWSYNEILANGATNGSPISYGFNVATNRQQ